MREIVLDTETTGLDPSRGDRIVEIGALELLNHVPTGQAFHAYINPQRSMPKEAEAVHGLSTEFLKDKLVFGRIAEEFLAFIQDSVLVIHNAPFDVGFLNAELALLGRSPLAPERIIDTLQLARQKHPAGPNSLDALCRRYGIDNSRRTRHGALLDSELLADVYVELIGGRQTALAFATAKSSRIITSANISGIVSRPRDLPPRLSMAEFEAHERLVEALGDGSLWGQLSYDHAKPVN